MWTITLGARYDHICGDLDDNLTGLNTDMENFDIFSPKAAVEFTPIEGYTFFSTYGEGFRLPGGFDKFTYTDISRVPDWLFSIGAKWQPPDGMFAGFDYRYVGEAYLEDYATDYVGTRKNTIDYWVANAQIGYRYKKYSLTLDAKNLFDERYPSTESANSLRTANPRSFFVTFAVNY